MNLNFEMKIFILLLLMDHSSSLIAQQIYFPPEDSILSARYNYTIPPRNSPTYDETVDKVIARGVSQMTLSIAKSITSVYFENSKVFAPINIAGALAMILLGSSGKTFLEVSNILGLATGVDINSKSQLVHEQFGRLLRKLDRISSFDLGEELTLANAVFVQEKFPIRGVYKQISEDVYRSEILSVDFLNDPESAKNTINAWVNDRSKGKISSILSENPPAETKVIITAALYFKAAWEQPFIVGSTTLKPFYTNGRDSPATKKVQMMANGGWFPHYEDDTLNCQIMGFPYKGNKTTMYVVIPKNSDRHSVINLQNRLSTADLERLVENTRYKQSLILFPKMKIESFLDLKQALQDLGVRTLFNPAESNLALLSPGRNPLLQSRPSDFLSSNTIRNPMTLNDGEPVLIFSRTGVPTNCTEVFNSNSSVTECKSVDDATNKQVTYKKFGEKVGRRVTRDLIKKRKRQLDVVQTLDKVRAILTDNDNPGLYVDQVLHKVYMDITELGTEAAAVTSATLSRTGDYVNFRVDVPFLFFIRNHETKVILFWGTVLTPTPNFDA